LVDILSYWTFSDAFEEQDAVKQPFYGGYGLIAEDGLPKPSCNAFKLLRRLGERRGAVNSQSALVIRRADDSIVMAIWNLFLPDDQGQPKDVSILAKGLTSPHRSFVSQLNAAHGSLLRLYDSMGGPTYPTPKQPEDLLHAAELPAPEMKMLRHGKLTQELPPPGLVLIEIR
jgi:xylan 1,4-beta-xylosidase